MPELHIGRHITITTEEEDPSPSDYVLRVYPTDSMLVLEEHSLPAEVFEVLAKWHKDLNAVNPDKNPYFADEVKQVPFNQNPYARFPHLEKRNNAKALVEKCQLSLDDEKRLTDEQHKQYKQYKTLMDSLYRQADYGMHISPRTQP